MVKRRKVKMQKQGSGTAVYLIISIAVFMLTLAGLTAAFAVLMCSVDVPYSYITAVSTVLICVSAFVAAAVMSLISGTAWYACGLILSVIILIAVFIAGKVCGVMPSSFLLTKALSVTTSGLLGSFAGTIMREKRKKIR